MTAPNDSSIHPPELARDPEGFTEAARLRGIALLAIGATVETLSPGNAAAWLHGHVFLIKNDGELVEL